MPLARSDKRNRYSRVKPVNSRLVYDRSYWSRLGLPQPLGFWPVFGVGRSGGLTDYSPNGFDLALAGTVTFSGTQWGIGASFTSATAKATFTYPGYASLTSFSIFAWVITPSVLSNNPGLFSWNFANGETFYGSAGATFNYRTAVTATILPAANTFCHIGYTQTSANVVQGYLNGQKNGNNTSSLFALSNAASGLFALGGGTGTGNEWKGSILQFVILPVALTPAQVFALYQQPWAMFGTRDYALGTSAGPISTTGAGFISAVPTLLASNLYGARMRVAGTQSDIASSIHGGEGTIVSTKTIIASSVKAAAAGIQASHTLIASSLRAASASIQASAARSVTHNLTTGEATVQARSAEIASSILHVTAQLRALSSQTNQQAVQALAHFAASGSPHVLTNLLSIQEHLAAAATEINHTTRAAAGHLSGEAVSAVTLNLLSLAEHVEALASELASEIEHPGAGGGARATVVASNPAHGHSSCGAAAQVFSTSGHVPYTAWAVVIPKYQATVVVKPKYAAEVEVVY